jgi:protein O-GlcNAc transferase
MDSTVKDLAIGLQLQRAGRFQEAEAVYRRIVAADPGHADTWRLLGMLALEARQFPEAIQHIKRAIGLQPQNPLFHSSAGMVHASQGNWPDAADSFQRALQLDPHNPETQCNLGTCFIALGKPVEGLGCFREAIRLEPDSFTAHWNAARTLHHLGLLDETVSECRAALRLRPESADVHSLLSHVFRDQGRVGDEIASLREVLRLTPRDSDARNRLGLALARSGESGAALNSFQDAIALRPGFTAALRNLGTLLNRLGRSREAEQAFLRAIQSDPADATLHIRLGYLQEDRGDLAGALAAFERAAQLEPGRADAYRPLGWVLHVMGRPQEALAAYRKAAQLDPTDTAALNDLAILFQELGHYEESEEAFKRALDLDPRLTIPHANLAYLLADQGRGAEAERHYEQALRLEPSHRLRMLAETRLPPIYDSEEQIHACRERLAVNLNRLFEEGACIDPAKEVMPTLFYTAYHGLNDRDLMAALARLGRSSWQAAKPFCRPSHGKIQIGFLSRNFRSHTIGKLMAGVIAHLDRRVFDVVVLSLGRHDDPVGRRIRESATRYVQVPTTIAAALQTIAGQKLDILFYPDIGMDPLTYTMACNRLAPVQVTTWGHPVTSGLPTMDYFISSEHLDTPIAQEHYTERLVRLPAVSVLYDRPTPVALKGRAFFGLPSEAHLYACPQTLFKLHPDFDDLLGRILRSDPAGIIVLIEGRYSNWNDILRKRFARTIPDVIDRVRWVPRQSYEHYLNLLAVSDVSLDPTHFVGGNSSYEALALGLPIVTLPSEFLRGRITYALYKKMGVMDCVAENRDDYVRLALELGSDPSRREALRAKILDASGVLFEDFQAVRDLGHFLESVVPGS